MNGVCLGPRRRQQTATSIESDASTDFQEAGISDAQTTMACSMEADESEFNLGSFEMSNDNSSDRAACVS